jgi:hypothetical protein
VTSAPRVTAIVAFAVLPLASCANHSRVVPYGGDRYFLSTEDAELASGDNDPRWKREWVLREANRFCKQSGKVMHAENVESHSTAPVLSITSGIRPGTRVTLIFACVEASEATGKAGQSLK